MVNGELPIGNNIFFMIDHSRFSIHDYYLTNSVYSINKT